MAKKNKVVEDTPVAEEIPVEAEEIVARDEETPVETPVDETPVEETPVEETPVEETPVEETPEEVPAEEGLVKANGQIFKSITEAQGAIEPGVPLKIDILGDIDDMEGVGFWNKGMPGYCGENYEPRDMEIDFHGHTITITHGAKGSGTQYSTQGFHLEKGASVVMKNGRLETIEGSGVKMLIQTYLDLTLENMVLNANKKINGAGAYTASNNYGKMTVKGNTEIYANTDGVAFDAWYNLGGQYPEGVEVVFDKGFCGLVDGPMEYGAGKPLDGWKEKTKIDIAGNGEFTGEIKASSTGALDGASIAISGGAFTTEAAKTAASQFFTEDYSEPSEDDVELSRAGAALGIEDVNELPETADTEPLDDEQIQGVIKPLLELAGDVPVETATPLS